jgi:glycogen operon protein
VEGPSQNPALLALRRKQAKNAYALLLLSRGVPMILAGDEFLHSQQGNNNCYCQDNELSWLNWRQAEQNADMLRFVQKMIKFRKRHTCLMRRQFLTGKPLEGKTLPDITWYGAEIDEQPRWDDPDTRLIAFTLAAIAEHEADIHVVMNMSEQRYEMQLPTILGKVWCLAVDTSLKSPYDIIRPEDQQPLREPHYPIDGHSVTVFETRLIADDDQEHGALKTQTLFNKIAGMKLF